MSKTFSSLSILGLGSSNSHPAVKSQFLARIKGPLKRMTSTFFHTKSKRERTSSFGSNFEWDGPEDGFTSQYKEDRRIKVAHRPVVVSAPVILRHPADHSTKPFPPDWKITFPSKSAIAPPRPPREIEPLPLKRGHTIDRIVRSRGTSAASIFYENRPKNIPTLNHSRSLSGLPTYGLGLDFLETNESELDFSTTILNSKQKRQSMKVGNLALNEAIHSFFDHSEGVARNRSESVWSESEDEDGDHEDGDDNWQDRGEKLLFMKDSFLPPIESQTRDSFSSYNSSNDYSSKDSLIDPESTLFNNFPRISVESFPDFLDQEDEDITVTLVVKNLLATVEKFHDCASSILSSSSHAQDDEISPNTPVLSSSGSCESLESTQSILKDFSHVNSQQDSLDLKILDSNSLITLLLLEGEEGVNVNAWRQQ